MRTDILLIWLHVTGNVFWIGSIVAVALIILSDLGDPKVRGELATKVYLRGAVPAFVLSFLTGAGRLVLDSSHYLKQPWMHIKLTMALAVIALHHIIGARAKKLASGETDSAGPTKILAIVLAICAVAATFSAIVELPGRSAPPPAETAP